MIITSYIRPELEIVQQVRELERTCQAQDGLSGSLFLDPSLNFSADAPCLFAAFEEDRLLGAMTFFVPTQEEAEVVCLTHPNFRRRGVFRALLSFAAAWASEHSVQDLMIVCEPKSEAGQLALRNIQKELDHTEYALRYGNTQPPDLRTVPSGLTLHRATENDLSDMVMISADSFADSAAQAEHFLSLALVSTTRKQYIARLNGEPVAIGALGYEGNEATVYGLGVLKRLQNKGIGRGLVTLLLREAFADGVPDVLIEVDSTNARAHHLYLSSGFVAEATYDYFRAPINQFL